MDTRVIKNRREQIATEIAQMNARQKDLEAELLELDVAERVFNRLTGATATESAEPISRRAAKLTVRQMIKAALRDARQRNLHGLQPKDIRTFIKNNYGQEIGQQINTTASRMWHDLREIEKDETTGAFYLREEKPADDLTVESPSTGFDRNQEHGREAGQGDET